MGDATLTDDVRRLAGEWLMDLVGVADLEPACHDRPEVFADLPRAFPRAVAMALRLSRAVLATCTDGPTPLYFHHYRQANYQLDRAALAVAAHLQRAGHDALPVPASQVIGEDPMRGHISHRAVAALAGLGWRGRNNLLVTPAFGAQVRLVTVLTDAPLEADQPFCVAHALSGVMNPSPPRGEGEGEGRGHSARPASDPQPRPYLPVSLQGRGFPRAVAPHNAADCGACRRCVAVCPAQAIGETPADFDLAACYRQLCEFRKRPFIGQHICGLCVRACDGRARSSAGPPKEGG